MTWRVGRKLGRTLYRQVDDGPDDKDEFLGIMETRALAEHVVSLVNRDPIPGIDNSLGSDLEFLVNYYGYDSRTGIADYDLSDLLMGYLESLIKDNAGRQAVMRANDGTSE